MGLAKTAKWYDSGLVVTNGQSSKPAGPLYPELVEAIGDQPVIERAVDFNSFLDESFAQVAGPPGGAAPRAPDPPDTRRCPWPAYEGRAGLVYPPNSKNGLLMTMAYLAQSEQQQKLEWLDGGTFSVLLDKEATEGKLTVGRFDVARG
ncbi:hypothetical protein ABTY51_49450, partial [Streptomyces sp. NPDC094472]